MRKLSIFMILWLTVSMNAGGQDIQIAEFLQEGDNSGLTSDKLIFLDFWATWCGPCINSMPNVDRLVHDFKDEIFFISITSEGPVQVERFLEQHETATAVALDWEGVTHASFNIKSIPEAVLLDRTGDIVWRGHPAEVTPEELRGYINRNHRSAEGVEQVFLVNTDTTEANRETAASSNWVFAYLKDPVPSHLSKTAEMITYTGKIDRLLSSLTDFPLNMIQLSDELTDQYFAVRISRKVWEESPTLVLMKIRDTFNLNLTVKEDHGKVWDMLVKDSSLLWGTDIISWGEGAPEYMITDAEVICNDRTVGQFATILSEALNEPVRTERSHTGKHDWQVHFKYPNLMQEQLRTEYGIDLKIKEDTYKVVHVSSSDIR